MNRSLRIAAAQYPLDPLSTMAEYARKISDWVDFAAGQGAELLVFPEYGAMELGAIEGLEVAGDLKRVIDAVSKRLPDADAIHAELAIRHRVTIVAASGPERISDTRIVNTARIFGPTGLMGRYEKLMLTPWERDPWRLSPGQELCVFDIGVTRVGLLICYDIEFPLLSRALAEAGAEVLLAPSNTETEHGYWRVRTGAMARALENQVYTVHAPTVGPAPWCPAVENNVGSAGIFAPSDVGFPPSGVLATGEMNQPQWVFAEVDLDLLHTTRQSGGVRLFEHWREQPGARPLPPAAVYDLSESFSPPAEPSPGETA
jgi:predicted amidohydrolase